MSHHSIEWIDSGREPSCPPNPQFPEGIDIKAIDPEENHCLVKLPYPAKRCGVYMIHCSLCDTTIAVTTAGRIDDPRSVEVPCHFGKENKDSQDIA
mgnify:CR=1 FL=1